MNDLVGVIRSLESNEQAADFLCGILTPKEINEIVKRLNIIKMIKSGVAHRLIANKLSVGIATVTRGSKEIQNGRFKYLK